MKSIRVTLYGIINLCVGSGPHIIAPTSGRISPEKLQTFDIVGYLDLPF